MTRAFAATALAAAVCVLATSARASASAADGSSSSAPSSDDDEVIEWIKPQAPPAKPFNPLLELTEANFDDAIASHEYILVEFFAKWCGTCRMVGPEFQHAAWLSHNRSVGVAFAGVDIDKEPELTAKYNVDIFPTFFLFRNGKPEPFPMLATGEGYIAGLNNLLGLGLDISPAKIFGPTATSFELSSWLFWRGANSGKIATTLALYEPAVPTEQSLLAAKVFDEASSELFRNPNYRFTIVRSPSIMEDYEIDTTKASLIIYKNHDEGRTQYDGPLDARQSL